MDPTRLSGLNLNALVALDALLGERNVTRAAKRIGITQPAMSQSLARLRELFGDPLLVRKGRAMVLTPRAEAMLMPLSDALLAVERALQLGMGFEAKTSTRIFKVALTDLGVTTALPSVLRVIGKQAPGIRVQVEPLSDLNLPDKLSSGEIDLVVAVYLGSAGGLRTEALLEEDYVCLARRGHPLARRKRLRVQDYEGYGHVAYTPVGFVPRPMAKASRAVGSGAAIRVSVPYLLAVPEVIRRSDLVATVPRSLLSAPIDLDGVATIEAPPELPRVEHSQWWHPRFDLDPAHQWLRARVREAFV